MAEDYNKNSHGYKMPKLKDLVKGSGFEEIPKEMLVSKALETETDATKDSIDAKIKALKDESIAGVGLDVYDKEPLPQDHKLRFLPNALLMPHIGFVTAENYTKFYTQMIENLEGCLNNKPIRVIS